MEGHTTRDFSRDSLAGKLRTITHSVLVLIFGLLPLAFIPIASLNVGYTKSTLIIFGIAIALIFFSLSVLRSGKVVYSTPYAFWALWGTTAVVVVSGLLSGDLRDSLFGDILGVHTAAFVGILALTTTIWSFVDMRKESVMRFYMLIVLSTFVLVVYHVLRLFFGAGFLSFGIFTDAASSPIGSWNDLALFLGLTVLLALVTLEQLPLTKWGRIVFAVVVASALIMLSVINFFFVWIVLGLVSMVLVVYSLGKDRFVGETHTETRHAERSLLSLVVPVGVFIVSALFILGGSTLSGFIAERTGISYLEVRPSFEATADIARGVYSENAFLGAGPNRFSDAWRQYKDASIGNTMFWNTDFQSGSGYIPTFFVTTGVVGGVAWMLFLALFIFGGMRMLLRGQNQDRIWYFIGTSSFVGAVFIWGMSFVYVPGATVLILGALCTGLTFLAQGALNPEGMRSFALSANRRTGFVLTLAVMVVIMLSVGVMYLAGRQYVSAYLFVESARAAQPGVELESIEQMIARAFELSGNDLYARRIAEYQLARMNTLLSAQNPTDAERQQFQNAVVNGINAGELAIARDSSDPENHAVLGRIYSILVETDVEGSYERAKESLERARILDPISPLRRLELAQLETRAGNFGEARRYTDEAIQLKSNYSDAFFFLTQLDIAEGNVEGAINSTRTMISLEPQNPTRYYQLGVLEMSRKTYAGAVTAFEEAVRLNPEYSNARYFLAIAYSQVGKKDEAKAQLEEVQRLNPGNETVAALITELDTTGTIKIVDPTTTQDQLVEGGDEVSESDDDVTSKDAPDTPLVTPVNTPGETSTEEGGAQ